MTFWGREKNRWNERKKKTESIRLFSFCLFVCHHSKLSKKMITQWNYEHVWWKRKRSTSVTQTINTHMENGRRFWIKQTTMNESISTTPQFGHHIIDDWLRELFDCCLWRRWRIKGNKNKKQWCDVRRHQRQRRWCIWHLPWSIINHQHTITTTTNNRWSNKQNRKKMKQRFL